MSKQCCPRNWTDLHGGMLSERCFKYWPSLPFCGPWSWHDPVSERLLFPQKI